MFRDSENCQWLTPFSSPWGCQKWPFLTQRIHRHHHSCILRLLREKEKWQMGEPGGLPSMGLRRVEQDWSDLEAAMSVKRLSFPWAHSEEGKGSYHPPQSQGRLDRITLKEWGFLHPVSQVLMTISSFLVWKLFSFSQHHWCSWNASGAHFHVWGARVYLFLSG